MFSLDIGDLTSGDAAVFAKAFLMPAAVFLGRSIAVMSRAMVIFSAVILHH